VGESRGGVEGVGGRLMLPFKYNGTSCVPEELSHGSQTTLQGCLVAVMDNGVVLMY